MSPICKIKYTHTYTCYTQLVNITFEINSMHPQKSLYIIPIVSYFYQGKGQHAHLGEPRIVIQKKNEVKGTKLHIYNNIFIYFIILN